MIISENKCESCGGRIDSGVLRNSTCTHCGKPVFVRQPLSESIEIVLKRKKGIDRLVGCMLFFEDNTVVKFKASEPVKYQTNFVENKIILKPKNFFPDSLFLDRKNTVILFEIAENAKEVVLEFENVGLTRWNVNGEGVSNLKVIELSRAKTKEINKKIKLARQVK